MNKSDVLRHLNSAFLAFPRWIGSFCDPTDPRTSANFLAMLTATFCLAFCAVKCTFAICHQFAAGRAPTMTDVAFLVAVYGPLAALGGAVYSFRPDGSFTIGDSSINNK